MIDPLDRLLAIEAIRQVKARYFLHLDRKQWADWRALFTHDAVMDTSAQFPDAADPSIHILRGADAIVASVSRYTRNLVTVHHGFTPIIEMTAPTHATGIWAMEDHLVRPDGSRFVGQGHYEDAYRYEGGGWRIARSTLHRLATMTLPIAPPPARTGESRDSRRP